MQSSATSGSSELLQLVHLHSVTHHCKYGHVVDMCTSLCCTVSCNYKIRCLAVLQVPQACQSVLVDIFHLQCATHILLASYCHIFLSSTLHDSTLEGCGTMQPLRSAGEYAVPHAMFLWKSFNRTACMPRYLVLPLSQHRTMKPALVPLPQGCHISLVLLD